MQESPFHKQPSPAPLKGVRRRLTLRQELLLAVLPTATVLIVLFSVEVLSEQQVLFSSLASSAFLIYLYPDHSVSQTRTLIVSQLSAAAIGFAAFHLLGPGVAPAGVAMVLVILLMITLDVVHPPAVGTSLIFSFRNADQTDLALFVMAVSVIALLVAIERGTLYVFRRVTRSKGGKAELKDFEE